MAEYSHTPVEDERPVAGLAGRALGATASRDRARLPNLIIAGVGKGGTTSLFRYLGQHPQVCASRVKELRYFQSLRYGEPMAPLDQYTRHFAHWNGQR